MVRWFLAGALVVAVGVAAYIYVQASKDEADLRRQRDEAAADTETLNSRVARLQHERDKVVAEAAQATEARNMEMARTQAMVSTANNERDAAIAAVREEHKVAEAARLAQTKAEADTKQATDTVADVKRSLDAAEKNFQMLEEAVKLKEADTRDLRAKCEAMLKGEADMNITLSKLLKENEWAKKMLVVKEEQLAEAQEMLAKAKDYIRSKGLVFDPTVPMQAPVRLAAKIEDVYEVAGGFSAKISLGADVQIQKGMKFIVSDDTGKFMGELIVDEVEAKQSVGRLAGPFAKDVTKGMKVIAVGS